MQLQIKPNKSNTYPLAGILIRGNTLKTLLNELQYLGIDLQQIPVYPIPGNTANSLWGCFAPYSIEKITKKITTQEPCQLVNDKLFIPTYSIIHPLLSQAEVGKIFPQCKYILHPEFGLVALESPISWTELLEINTPQSIQIITPKDGIYIPQNIHRVEVKSLPLDEFLKAMEDNFFPKKETFKDEPLNWKEKIKLSFLKFLFTSKADAVDSNKISKGKLLELLQKYFPNQEKRFENLQQDLEELEKRNSSELEKLMDLFKNNPEEALKYSIPLDSEGVNRGGDKAAFSMNKRWNTFDLFGTLSSRGRGGNALFSDDTFSKLQEQYTKTAQEYIKNKNFEKAVFVYMKLLKNNLKAAQTLEEGKMYPEAASVYLKYLQNKNKAAECYEKGQMTSNAIDLYKELKQFEKVGDLYITQNNKAEAYLNYNIVIDEYKNINKYVKASLLYRNKMNDNVSAQELLLEGWRKEKDAFNCLNNYFENIKDNKELAQEIEYIYAHDTNISNKSKFLEVLKYEHKKDETLKVRTKEIAYEIVAELAQINPSIVNELKNFNKDKSLIKDISRYKGS